MSPSRTARLRVVVDGSNLATEGRVTPSLAQLNEAVGAFAEENPGAEIIVVADASFEHRAPTSDRGRFNDAVLAGDIVTPPAGAVGRGDAFILKIADRIGGVVLSNDSFQEFQDDYPWLFEEGRLIGGKPVRGVGWVFTPRLPVRAIKSSRASKKLAITLPSGKEPTIGTTLTPVKATKKAAPAKKAAKVTEATNKAARAPEKAERAPEKPGHVEKAVTKKSSEPLKKATKKSVKGTETAKKSSAAKVSEPAKKSLKKAAKVAEATNKATKAPVAVEPVVALRRGRHPVNPEADFTRFRAAYKVGAKVPGEVTAFTSHGAVITVALKGGETVECYAPTTSLGNPPPARARDVLKRGDQRTFRLVNVDVDRRIAELALV